MSNQSFTGMAKAVFNGAGDAPDRKRTLRIDAETLGYPVEGDEKTIVSLGMSPVGDGKKGDLWRIVEINEEENKYLLQIDENERMWEFKFNTEQEPMEFKDACERLAVWQYARMLKGARPADSHTDKQLGSRYFIEVARVRGYVVNSVGKVSEMSGDFPAEGGKYLKSHIEAMRAYHKELAGGDVLGALFSAHDPRYLSNTSIEEDITSFGEINLFDKMKFFAKILVEYANIQLRYIEEFYGNPSGANREALYERLNAHSFFSPSLFERYNGLRTEFAMDIFRHATVNEVDWGRDIDFNDKRLQIELLKKPDMKAIYDGIAKEVTGPFDNDELQAMLLVSARALLFFREALKDSAQKDALEQANIYKQSDVLDLLNFLDLLDAKYQYIELAKIATALRGTKEHKELEQKTEKFKQLVVDIKANMKDAGELSPPQEAQVDNFIKANAKIYLLDRIKQLPDRLAAAYDFISARILPANHQLTLDLDYTQKRTAAPTRQSYEETRQAASVKPAMK